MVQLNETVALTSGPCAGVGKGHFSHHDLFPALYPEASTSGTASSSHHAPYVSPPSLSASSFPSALALSAEFHSDLAPPPASSSSTGQAAASHPQSRLKAPFEAFVAAASEALLVALLTDTTATQPRPTSTTRLDSAVVYLPPTTEAYGSSARREAPDAVKASLHLSLQRTGILIQSSVEDVPYRPFPIAVPPPPSSPLLLGPFSTSAQFVKFYPPEAKRGAAAVAMEEEWKALLEGTGLCLGAEEAWVLCRIDLPSSAAPPSPDNGALPQPSQHPEPLEIMWPASLCILDGTQPQPSRSPNSTPPRAHPPELASGAPPSPQNATSIFVASSACSSRAIFPPLDLSTRRRFASVLRRGVHSSSSATETHSPSAYHDPIAYRAERVGAMLEEQAEERQRAAEAALKAASVAALPPPPPTPSSIEGGRAGIPLPSVAAGTAGAPINMRTPISLGGSSTEAPSPADGFGNSAERGLMQALGGYGALPTGSAGVESGGGSKNAEMDHLYPSPSEAMGGGGSGGGGGGAAAPGAGGGEPMQGVETQVDNVFPEFDWGDDFASGGMGGRGNMPGQGQDFDDGMMMGLTDDDFSFFDDPAPLPASVPMASFGGLASSGPSPKFVDHFSHLASTPFASAASPTSPFGQPSPHLPQHHGSPNLLSFSFDPAHNALGLGSTPGPHHGGGIGEGCSPFKTPRTPYSPFIEITDDHETPVAGHLPTATVSIAGTPAHSLLPPYARRPGQFDAIHFGTSHTLSDDKYDARKGKFGLPSPDWDRDLASTVGASSGSGGIDLRPLPLAVAPWYSVVCDPRIAVANELKRKRTPSLAKLAIVKRSSSSAGRSDYFARVRVPREWVTQDADSEYGEDESEDEAMDLGDEASVLGGTGGGADDISLADHYVGGVAINYTFGAALLLLRQHLATLLASKRQPPASPVATSSKQQLAADGQLETALGMIADQTMYNPDFRARATSRSLLKTSTTLISESLARRSLGAVLIIPSAIQPLLKLYNSLACASPPSPLAARPPSLPPSRSRPFLRLPSSVNRRSSSALSNPSWN